MGVRTFGTLIIVKNKYYFDFTLNVDVLTRSRGSFGIFFRMQDPYSFLAIDINIEQGVKRIIKFDHGNVSVLKQLNDGGIPQNTWYKLQIQAVRNRFIVRMGDASTYQEYKGMPIIFQFENSSFSRGQ